MLKVGCASNKGGNSLLMTSCDIPEWPLLGVYVGAGSGVMSAAYSSVGKLGAGGGQQTVISLEASSSIPLLATSEMKKGSWASKLYPGHYWLRKEASQRGIAC